MKSAIKQVLVHRTRHKRDRLVTGAALSGYLYVLESSVWTCEEAACKLTSTERSHCKGPNPEMPRVTAAGSKSKEPCTLVYAYYTLQSSLVVHGSTIKLIQNAVALMHHKIGTIQVRNA